MPNQSVEKFALLYTYDGKDPHAYLCDSKVSAQKEMLSSIAETREAAVKAGYEATFEIDNLIMSAKIIMKRGRKSETMFVYVVPICK